MFVYIDVTNILYKYNAIAENAFWNHLQKINKKLNLSYNAFGSKQSLLCTVQQN